MDKRLLLPLSGGLLLMLLLGSSVESTCFDDVSLNTLTRDATRIVVGRVRGTRTVLGTVRGVEGEVPFQEIDFKVFDSWKGTDKVGDRITLRFPGGTLPDGSMLTVSTSPAVEDVSDSPALLFLDNDCFGDGLHGLCHKSLGLYRIEKRPGGPIVRGKPGHPIRSSHPVSDMLSQVRDIVTTQAQETVESQDDQNDALQSDTEGGGK